MEYIPGILFLLGLLVAVLGLIYARGYWWVVLLAAPGLLGAMLMPQEEGNAKAAGYILIIVAYAVIVPLLAGSGLLYLLGNAIEARQPGAPPGRSIRSSMLYHAPLSLGIAISVLAVARFVHLGGKAPGTRIIFAIGAAIPLGYVVYRRIRSGPHGGDRA